MVDARKAVEFYSIELAQLADGTFHVSLTATTVDDEEPQLLCQEITSERVASINDALALIREGVVRDLNVRPTFTQASPQSADEA